MQNGPARRIGFIGLGAMGRPMAMRLLEKGGYPICAHDIVQERVRHLTARGATTAASPQDVAAASDVVITMLPNSPDVEAVVLGPKGVVYGLRSGTVLIDMSTINPNVSRRIAAAVVAVGARMLDAPVGRTSRHAAEGTLLIMVGGEPSVLEECRPILRWLGTDILHCGPAGAGATMKLVNNLLTATIIAANAEALVLGVKAGLNADLMLQVLRSTGASNTHLRVTYAEQALRGNLTPGFAVRLAAKDLGLALGLAADNQVPVVVAAAAQQLLNVARCLGHDDDDYTSVLSVLEMFAGVAVREAGDRTPVAPGGSGA